MIVTPFAKTKWDAQSCQENWQYWSDMSVRCKLFDPTNPEGDAVYRASISKYSKFFVIKGIPYTVEIEFGHEIKIISQAVEPKFEDVKDIIQETWNEAIQRDYYRIRLE
jgi:hypothetical protein